MRPDVLLKSASLAEPIENEALAIVRLTRAALDDRDLEALWILLGRAEHAMREALEAEAVHLLGEGWRVAKTQGVEHDSAMLELSWTTVVELGQLQMLGA